MAKSHKMLLEMESMNPSLKLEAEALGPFLTGPKPWQRDLAAKRQ